MTIVEPGYIDPTIPPEIDRVADGFERAFIGEGDRVEFEASIFTTSNARPRIGFSTPSDYKCYVTIALENRGDEYLAAIWNPRSNRNPATVSETGLKLHVPYGIMQNFGHERSEALGEAASDGFVAILGDNDDRGTFYAFEDGALQELPSGEGRQSMAFALINACLIARRKQLGRYLEAIRLLNEELPYLDG